MSRVAHNPYTTLLLARCRQETQYRAAAIFGMATQLFWGLVRIAIFTAFLRAGAAKAELSLPQTITYLWIVQGMIRVLPWSVDADIKTLVHQGTVVYELLRPVDLYWSWFARALARHAVPTAMRALPLFAVAMLLFHMQAPGSVLDAIRFLTATALALILASAISTLISISLLFTLAGDGIQRLLPAVVNFASGLLIPISFLPAGLRHFLRLLPFCDLIDTPARLYLGKITGEGAVVAFAYTIIWTATLALLGKLLISRASKRMVIHGG